MQQGSAIIYTNPQIITKHYKKVNKRPSSENI